MNDALLLVDVINDFRHDWLAAVAPQPGDRFVVKPRYSAFLHTPLEVILRELELERILLAGNAIEMCVVQTAIDAREHGFKVTVLADACATLDARDEETALRFLENVVGAVSSALRCSADLEREEIAT